MEREIGIGLVGGELGGKGRWKGSAGIGRERIPPPPPTLPPKKYFPQKDPKLE